ncbi:hypothetical protein CPC08DRAFT_703437 [Agrocybe pediades]|nr:hypothetical protein CPC08DRAFT_703437 [Agrocybe pediades]
MAQKEDRTVMIDDTDKNIIYAGSWFTEAGIVDSSTGGGSAYLGSLHGTTSDSSLQYSFRGISVIVAGSVYNLSEPTFPSWECFINGSSFAKGSSLGVKQARQSLCSIGSLDADSTHTIALNVSGKVNQALFFDYLRYTPSPADPLVNEAVVRVGVLDSALLYSPGWKSVGSALPQVGGLYSTNMNATLSLSFIGNSLSWWGYTVAGDSGLPAPATLELDGKPPEPFVIPALPSPTSPSQINVQNFDTGALAYGVHNMTVTYMGGEGYVPLALDYLLITNGTLAETTTTTPRPHEAASVSPAAGAGSTATSRTVVGPSPSTESTSDTHKKTLGTGAKAAVAVSAIALLCIIAILIWWCRWRRRRRDPRKGHARNSIAQIDPFDMSQHRSHRQFLTPMLVPIKGTNQATTSVRAHSGIDAPPSYSSFVG